MTVPQLIVCCGPMFSGKSTKLLWYLDRFKYQNKNIVSFKPERDDRYSTTQIVSHSGWKMDAILVSSGKDIDDILSKSFSVDVIGIDEMFMIPGSAEIALKYYRAGTTIVIASLDLSSDHEPFDEVAKILPYATIVEKCSAVCAQCDNDAHFTYAKVPKDSEISVGGAEKYEPRCFEHYKIKWKD